MNKAVISMQIDIGFGDVISPAPQVLSYPTVLDLPAPQLKGYTPESVIAEKLETMIKRGMLNSRMKDFYDIWALSNQFAFNHVALANAIQATFKQRGTTLEATPECFSEAFIADPSKNAQWQSFIRKTALSSAPTSLNAAISQIKTFLEPILNSPSGDSPNINWHPLHASWSA